MAETREIVDPFDGKTVSINNDLTVSINNDLVRRLRGQYAVGPTLPNGEPEFGWRTFGEPSAINLEAATEIERLRALLWKLRSTAALLAQNAEGCAVNHYGKDFQIHGMPGWLADCKRDIEAALTAINN